MTQKTCYRKGNDHDTATQTLATILVLTLFLGVATTASAAVPETRGGLLRGKVTTIAGDSLTLQTRWGEVTLLTDEGTAFDLPGIENAALDDLAVGDFHRSRGAR